MQNPNQPLLVTPDAPGAPAIETKPGVGPVPEAIQALDPDAGLFDVGPGRDGSWGIAAPLEQAEAPQVLELPNPSPYTDGAGIPGWNGSKVVIETPAVMPEHTDALPAVTSLQPKTEVVATRRELRAAREAAGEQKQFTDETADIVRELQGAGELSFGGAMASGVIQKNAEGRVSLDKTALQGQYLDYTEKQAEAAVPQATTRAETTADKVRQMYEAGEAGVTKSQTASGEDWYSVKEGNKFISQERINEKYEAFFSRATEQLNAAQTNLDQVRAQLGELRTELGLGAWRKKGGSESGTQEDGVAAVREMFGDDDSLDSVTATPLEPKAANGDGGSGGESGGDDGASGPEGMPSGDDNTPKHGFWTRTKTWFAERWGGPENSKKRRVIASVAGLALVGSIFGLAGSNGASEETPESPRAGWSQEQLNAWNAGRGDTAAETEAQQNPYGTVAESYNFADTCYNRDMDWKVANGIPNAFIKFVYERTGIDPNTASEAEKIDAYKDAMEDCYTKDPYILASNIVLLENGDNLSGTDIEKLTNEMGDKFASDNAAWQEAYTNHMKLLFDADSGTTLSIGHVDAWSHGTTYQMENGKIGYLATSRLATDTLNIVTADGKEQQLKECLQAVITRDNAPNYTPLPPAVETPTTPTETPSTPTPEPEKGPLTPDENIDVPTEPGEPTTPEVPTTPETPINPEEPTTPEEPVTPEEPAPTPEEPVLDAKNEAENPLNQEDTIEAHTNGDERFESGEEGTATVPEDTYEAPVAPVVNETAEEAAASGLTIDTSGNGTDQATNNGTESTTDSVGGASTVGVNPEGAPANDVAYTAPADNSQADVVQGANVGGTDGDDGQTIGTVGE